MTARSRLLWRIVFDRISHEKSKSPALSENDGQAPVHQIRLRELKSSRRQLHLPLKTPVGDFKAMDGGAPCHSRGMTHARDQQHIMPDGDFDVLRFNAGQGSQYPKILNGFENVDGRTPRRDLRARDPWEKELTVHLLHPFQHRAGF
jgi:hypothetical protein